MGAVQFIPEMERLEKSDLLPGARLTGLNPKGLEVDLMKGEYLIELMSPKCGRCKESIPKLNHLVDEADMPAIVALSTSPQVDGPEAVQGAVAASVPGGHHL